MHDQTKVSTNPRSPFNSYIYLVRSDLYRVHGKVSLKSDCRVLLSNIISRYIFWLRTANYLSKAPRYAYPARIVAYLVHRNLGFKLGIFIPITTEIAAGLLIGHPGGIVINSRCTLGKNCTISHGVTIGKANRGRHKGYPQIGDNVYLGPGAKVIGAIRIGNNVAIGANAVLTCDAPDSAVMAGIPARQISTLGSMDYVNRTDYR